MILDKWELECGETLVVEDVEEWTCRLHDSPLEEWDEDYGFPPEFGCSCETRARWRPTGEIRIRVEPVFERVLREMYVPAIVKQLNEEVLWLGRLSD